MKAKESSSLSYVNGRFVPPDEPVLSVAERGFALADGVFETMVAAGGRIFRLGDHLARLREGAGVLELSLPTRMTIESALDETWSRSGFREAVLRLTVARGPDLGRGVRPPDGTEPTVVVRVFPLSPPLQAPDRGVALHTCSFPRNEKSPLVRGKFLAYTEAIAAWLEARRVGADDALWRNTKGNLACATSSNLFVLRDGRLVTPSREEGALPGIARRAVMESAARAGLEVTEEPVSPAALEDAAEAFLTNVVRGPVAAAEVDGRVIGDGKPGPVTRDIAQAYWREVGVPADLGAG